MNTTYVSPAEREGADAPAVAERPEVLIWDAPVRLVHWLLALSFLGAFLTAESERWRLLHASLGYTVGGLVAFRLLWGLIGTRHARFASFVRGPATVLRYLKSLWSGRPEHYAGHNPAGALAIVALLGLAALVTATGHFLYNDIGGHSMEDLHEVLAEAMLAVVGLHLAGVAIASLLHRENLVRAMITGRKRAASTEGIRRPWRPLALVVVAAVSTWGGWQALTAPAPGPTAHAATADGGSDARHVRPAEDDDR